MSHNVVHHDGTMGLVQGLSGPYTGFYVNQKKLLVHHEHGHRMLEHGSREYGGQDAWGDHESYDGQSLEMSQ